MAGWLDLLVREDAPIVVTRSGVVFIAGRDGGAVFALTPAIEAMFTSMSLDPCRPPSLPPQTT